MGLSKDQEEMWRKLSEPWKDKDEEYNITISPDGLTMFEDLLGDGTEVNEYELAKPFDLSTASYVTTNYYTAWGKR